MRGIDSSYAWWRLAASVGLSTVGGIGMWSLMVAIPAVQGDFGITRADISFAYTMNTLGFFAGGLGGWLSRQPRYTEILRWLTGCIFIGLGLRLALVERR